MTTPLLHPVGPEPAGVYWRRRLVLLLAVVGLVLLVAALTTRGGRADPVDASAATAGGPPPAIVQTPAGGTEPSAAPTEDPTAEPDDAPACADDQLEVAVATDASAYGAEGAPRFTLEATNTGDTACEVDLALSDDVEFLLVSGEDRIWSSRDCQEEAAERVVTLEPGATDAQTASWQRVRSEEGCPGDLPEPEPGTYEVTARVGKTTSEPARFTLD